MSDDFPRYHLPSAEKSLEEGLAMRVILPKDLFSTLKIIEKKEKGRNQSIGMQSSAMTTNSESGARNFSNNSESISISYIKWDHSDLS